MIRQILAVLLTILALLATGCGEEEKFNKAKAEILEEARQAEQIQVPSGLSGEALNTAIREASRRHKETLDRAEARFRELEKQFAGEDPKFNAEVEEARKHLKESRIQWLTKAFAPKIKGDPVMGVGIGCSWSEIEEVLGEPLERKETPYFKEFKYPGLVFNEIRDRGEGTGRPAVPLYGPDAYYLTGESYQTGSGIRIGMTKEEVLRVYQGKLASLDDHTDPRFILMKYDPTPDHRHAYNQFMQLTNGRLTRLIVATH